MTFIPIDYDFVVWKLEQDEEKYLRKHYVVSPYWFKNHPIKCKYCRKRFDHEYDVINHLRSHREIDIIQRKCKRCDVSLFEDEEPFCLNCGEPIES